MAEIDEIVSAVESSFIETRPPAGNIEEIFNGCLPEMGRFVATMNDFGWTWQGLLHVLETSDHHWAMVYGELWRFMRDPAFYYYAPAMLIFSMNPDSDVLQSDVCHQLLPNSHRGQDELARRRVALFTDDQRHAIALVVRYYVNSFPNIAEEEFELWEYWRPWLREN